jgi:membrane protease YdiL (CAAX protease family)
MTYLRPEVLVAALLLLAPLLFAGLAPERFRQIGPSLPRIWRFALDALLCAPYVLIAEAFGIFRWERCAVYALLPVAIALVLDRARRVDVDGRGCWLDFVVLVVLGLAVDLRWLEPAWPRGFAAFGKILLLDAGIYGFLSVRQLDGVGFDLRLKLRDLGVGLREFALYAPIAIGLGLSLGFLHFHAASPNPLHALGAFVFTSVGIAIPEEVFFRGWLQNLLERRVGRRAALLLTAVVFGLAHWNKRTHTFNWRYVLLATIAGVFYGRAWRAQRRVGASTITHATVDTLWSLWFR